MIQFDKHKPLLGSLRSLPPGDHLGLLGDDEQVDVLLQLRRKRSLDVAGILSKRACLTRSELEADYGADPDDIELVQSFARHFGLVVSCVETGKRLVHVQGAAQAISKAFHVQLFKHRKNGHEFRARVGFVFVPEELSGVVTGVFGLDKRPQARPRIRYSKKPASIFKPDAFDGNQLASIYNFPASQGKGSTIALIELGGGYLDSDIDAFFTSLNLPKPAVTSVSVNGGHNAPLLNPDADMEVCLDIEVAGAGAFESSIVVFFAPNDDQSFLEAILSATHDSVNKPDIISISWGAAEPEWTSQQMDAMDEAFQSACALGISVFCAAGDDGANDNVGDGTAHADFPSSSPHVTACGGTTLVVANGARQQESVWNDGDGSATGGGISSFFPRPAYQDDIAMPQNLSGNLAGRGLPDVCAVGDPKTGYAILVDGIWYTVGGTSAVAPLYASLLARINSLTNTASGLINLPLYKSGSLAGFNDITTGNNSVDGVTGYTAGVGWDAVSGWGSPNGTGLLHVISSQPDHST